MKKKTLKKLWQIGVLALQNVFILTCATNCAPQAEALSKFGSRGNEVRQIQQKLKSLGMYTIGVDGIYGLKTEKGVIQYQKKYKLRIDGIAGPQTLKHMKISGSSNSGPSTTDLNLLARIISAEARGESYEGQVAVGAVVLNRVQHPSFPDTISGVIYQPGAFTALTDGQFSKPVQDSCYKAAQDAINGWDPTGGAIYYYNPKTATNSWIRSRPVVKTIGRHVFCK